MDAMPIVERLNVVKEVRLRLVVGVIHTMYTHSLFNVPKNLFIGELLSTENIEGHALLHQFRENTLWR